MNIYKFKRALDACGETYDDVASLLGCTAEALKEKFEPDSLSSDEVTRLTRFLGLRDEDLTEIFYPELLSDETESGAAQTAEAGKGATS